MAYFQPTPAAQLTNENEKQIEKKTSNVINTRPLILITSDVIS